MTQAISSDPVRLTKVSKSFPVPGRNKASSAGQQVRPALADVSLSISAGDIVGIIGRSGAGKSTLVRLINGLERPDQGTVTVFGKDLSTLSPGQLRQLRSRIGMVFQQFNLFHSRTVAGNIAFPLQVHGVSSAQITTRVSELLDFVGLGELARRRVAQLSGGQKQRVGIARALATQPEILLADEATSALDPETTAEVLDLLAKVRSEFGTTIIVITHEMQVVRTICDHAAIMQDGQLAEYGDVYQLFTEPRTRIGKTFVSSSLHDIPNTATLDRLRQNFQGTLLSVAVTAQSTSRIFDILRPVQADVVYGSISEVAKKPFGSLTFAVQGPTDLVNAAIAELNQVTKVTVWRS